MTTGVGSRVAALLAAGVLCVASVAATAQETPAAAGAGTATQAYLPDSASPFGPVTISNEDAKTVTMPALAFTETPADADDFDKYYYFHRADTDFATAYADIVECDGFARGLRAVVAGTPTVYVPGSAAGVAGGIIGSAVIGTIFNRISASAEIRRVRRVNMRRCMNFKGYARYGLPKGLWEAFNFEESFSAVGAEERARNLKQQALVASGAKPTGKELGL